MYALYALHALLWCSGWPYVVLQPVAASNSNHSNREPTSLLAWVCPVSRGYFPWPWVFPFGVWRLLIGWATPASRTSENQLQRAHAQCSLPCYRQGFFQEIQGKLQNLFIKSTRLASFFAVNTRPERLSLLIPWTNSGPRLYCGTQNDTHLLARWQCSRRQWQRSVRSDNNQRNCSIHASR